jgi:hypothetical protein
MNDIDIQYILNKLRTTGEAVHLDNLDISWDYNNQLLNSKEILSIILTKISSVPLIPDFTSKEVFETIGVTQEQATMIQEYNKQLIFIQTLLEKFCIQEYVIESICKKMIDDSIESKLTKVNVVEGDNFSFLFDFMKNYQETNANQKDINQKGINQKGGSIIDMLKTIFTLFLLVTMVSPNIQKKEEIVDIIDSNKKSYSLGLINYSPDEFKEQLLLREPIKSGEISMNNIVVKYDNDVKKNLMTIFGQIKSLFSETPGGAEQLERIINEFNEQSRDFSREIEEICIELMIKANDAGIFRDFLDLDTLKETEDKIEKIESSVRKQTDEAKEGIIGSVTGAVVSGLSVPLTQDIVTPVAYISQLGSNIFEYISTTKVLTKEKSSILSDQKSVSNVEINGKQIFNEMERIEFESKLFTFSKLYCSLGFNLQIKMMETSIDIIGDKVPYMSMISLISTLDKNLAYQITLLSNNPLDESNKHTIMAFVSLQQRLAILKKITDALYNIVNFSGKIQLVKMETYANANTIREVDNYFDDQISKLRELLNDLNKSFPLREKNLEERNRLARENIELIIAENKLKDMDQNATSYARQREAERQAKEYSDWWLATKTVGASWLDVGLNSTLFAKEGIQKYTSAFVDLAGEGPLSIIKGILKFLDNILYQFLITPSGWAIIMSGLFVVGVMVGGMTGTIRIFVKGGQMFLAIVIGGFLFVYKIIKTPFGFIYRKYVSLFVTDYGPHGRQNYERFLTQSEEGEVYDNKMVYGGKLRKHKKKTRKQRKKMLTRRLNKKRGIKKTKYRKHLSRRK